MFGTLHFWFLVQIKKTARHQSVDRTSQRMSYSGVKFMRWIKAMLCVIPTIKNDTQSQYNFEGIFHSLPLSSTFNLSPGTTFFIIIYLPSLFFLLLPQILIILLLNNDNILLAQWISDISLRRQAGQEQSVRGTRENEKIRTMQ